MSVVKPAIQYPVLIAYLEGASNYTWLHFRNGEKQLLAKPISYLEAQPELVDFVRIHKTVLINPVCVERLLPPPRPKMAGTVQLLGGVLLPVSRRRWPSVAAQFQSKLMSMPRLRSRLVTLHRPLAPVPMPDPARAQSIMVVTDNALSALLMTEVTSQQWPGCRVRVVSQDIPLLDLLRQLPQRDLPVLLVLDARTARQERLDTLQRLKQTADLGWIPVVLLVAATDEAIYDGYYRHANSVIALGREHTQFVQTIKRVGQFWLETAALPAFT